MADQKLNINVGSSWNGAGMQRAMGAVDTLSRTAGKAARAVGGLGAAFGGLGGEVGKAVNSVAGFAGAFATGGVWGLAIAGVTTAIQLFKDSFSTLDEMKKKAEEQAKAWEKAEKAAQKWIETLRQEDFNKVISAGDKYISNLNKIAAAQNKVANAQAKLNAAQGALTISEMKASGASNFDIATEQSRISASEQEANVAAKRTALENAKRVEMEIKAQLDAAESASFGKIKADRTKQYEATKAREAAELELSEALLQQKRAAVEAADNIKKAEAQDDAAYEANMRANWEEVAVRAEREVKMKEEARAEQKLKKAIEDDATLQKNLNDATENLKKAEDEYAAALRNAKMATANLDGMSPQQIAASQGLHNGKAWDKMTSSGNWGTTNDFDQRKADNYFRTHPAEAAAIGYTPGLNASDQNRLNYLSGKKASGQELSKSQQSELDNLLARDPETLAQKAEKAADDAAEKVKAALEQKKEAEDKMRTNVAAIKTMMEKLGLK